jgi:hypothetical protein
MMEMSQLMVVTAVMAVAALIAVELLGGIEGAYRQLWTRSVGPPWTCVQKTLRRCVIRWEDGSGDDG